MKNMYLLAHYNGLEIYELDRLLTDDGLIDGTPDGEITRYDIFIDTLVHAGELKKYGLSLKDVYSMKVFDVVKLFNSKLYGHNNTWYMVCEAKDVFEVVDIYKSALLEKFGKEKTND